MKETPIKVSIVIPVFLGANTLDQLVEQILPLTIPQPLIHDYEYMVSEILLVHDCGPDDSDLVISDLSKKYSIIRPIWLTKNFGQHPATLAGISNSSGEWIATIDEDGQHNPLYIKEMLALAINDSMQIVYAKPSNIPPHGLIRNSFSRLAKKLAAKLLGNHFNGETFNSYRVIRGDIGRILAAYCGNGIYLDVGLMWVADKIGFCPVMLNKELRPSSYSAIKLIKHFFRMLLTLGTSPLRLISIFGLLSICLSIVIFIYALYGKFYAQTQIQGWASLLIVMSFFSGTIMLSLGIISEYLSLVLGISMGKPPFVISESPPKKIHK